MNTIIIALFARFVTIISALLNVAPCSNTISRVVYLVPDSCLMADDNPGGTGSTLNGRVLYRPWLTLPGIMSVFLLLSIK
jgi:hypothetical protein